MKITVVVPTYRRSKDLARCLAALKVQIRPVDELWIIVRDTDEETRTFLQNFDIESLPLQIATVTVVGVVAAMNIGLESASGDIIVFTDDDAAPHSDWLERIEAYFLSDPNIAGVGGRDWVYHGTELEDGAETIVGKLQWFGRLIGNHHIGIGEGREVDILKGVNMSFRRTSIQNLRFDPRMRGTGAQVHFEVMFCLKLKHLGWKLIYDSQIGVDHFRGDRFDEDQRDKFNQLAMLNAVHNETLALLEHLPILRRFAFLGWTIAIGTRDARGLFQWLRFLPKEGNLSSQKLWASWRGRWEGWQTWRNS
jgi:glycosyltransferase involved in cell wall biosynthesis